jgi:hypothetical protein
MSGDLTVAGLAGSGSPGIPGRRVYVDSDGLLIAT